MHEEKIMNMFNNCAVGKSLGVHIQELKEGFARGSLQVRKEHMNVFGSIHGGILFTFADHVGGACGNTLGQEALLVESTIQYLNPVKDTCLIFADATMTHHSRKLGRIDIRVYTEKDMPIAIMHMVFFLKNNAHERKTA